MPPKTMKVTTSVKMLSEQEKRANAADVTRKIAIKNENNIINARKKAGLHIIDWDAALAYAAQPGGRPDMN